MAELISKWNWMMDWCKFNLLNPADSTAYKLAEKAYNERNQ